MESLPRESPGQRRMGRHGWLPAESRHRILRPRRAAPSRQGENKAAGNLPAAKLIQRLVRVGKRASCYLTTHFPGSCHYQNLTQILSGSDGGSLDADLSGSHQDRGKTYWISRQAYNQESTRGPQAIERCVIGCSRCRCHQRNVNSASIPQFLDRILVRSIDRCRST